jgi:hypothetical protein
MKKIITLILVSGIVLFLYFWIKDISSEGFNITINNNTDQQIVELAIEYPSGPLKLKTLPEKSTIKAHINPTGNFGESEINLIYKNKNGVNQKIMIFGYIEKGYRGTAKINISSIDINGRIGSDVKAVYN